MPEGKKIGGFSIKGWAESATLVGIGLIDPTKIWGATVAPPVQASRRTIDGDDSLCKKPANWV